MTPLKAVRFLPQYQVQFGGRTVSVIDTDRLEFAGFEIELTKVEATACVKCTYRTKDVEHVRFVPLAQVLEWTPVPPEDEK